MLDSSLDSVQPRLPSLCLEYGADEGNCEQELEICERGMCFHSHWQFSSGTQVGVSLCYNDGNGDSRRARLEGIVVDCQAAALRCYRVTVLFMDVPEALLATIREVSSLLEPAPPAAEEPLPPLLARRRL